MLSAQAPDLVVTPNQLSFSYTQGGAVPGAQSVSVTSTGATLVYTATPAFGATWLQIDKPSLTTPQTVSFSLNPSQLPAVGSYVEIVQFNAPGAGNPFTQNVTVLLAVNQGGAAWTVAPSTLAFLAPSGGGTPGPQTVALTASTTTTFTAASSASWLAVTPTVGNVGPLGVTLTVSVNTAGLAQNTYAGVITISDLGGTNPPLSVSVSLTVGGGSSAVAADPTSLTFSGSPFSGERSSRTVNLTSNTGSPITFTAFAASSGWLTVSQSSATTPSVLTVTADATSLAGGVYNGTVILFGLNAFEVLRIPVTFNVGSLPTLALSRNALTFNFTGATPEAQTVLASSNVSNMIVTAVSNATWLSVASSSATAPSTLTVSVNPFGLTTGTYTGQITVTATGAVNSPLLIAVTLVVGGSNTLSVSPSSMTFTFQPGGSNPQPQPIFVTTSLGNATFTVTSLQLSGPPGWLSVGASSGLTPSSVNVSANPSGLAAGTYTGTVTITVADAIGSPQQVGVTFVVAGPSTITVTPDQLRFTVAVGSGISVPQPVSVLSNSGSVESYSILANVSWIVTSATTGLAPGGFTVSVNPGILTQGAYSGQITLTPTSGAARIVIVNLTVGAVAQLNVSPAAMTFTYQLGGTTPSAQVLSVSVNSTSQASFFVSATSTGNWLSAGASSGQTPANIAISVNPAGLAQGTYPGSLTISANNVTNSPITVPVSLVVQAGSVPVTITVSPQVMNFAYQTGGAQPATQLLQISGAQLAFTATVVGGTWLSVNPASATVPASLAVNVNTAGVQAGTHTASIIIAAPAASNSPITVQVTLTVTPGASFSVSPPALAFVHTGPAAPPPQTLTISSSSPSLSYSAGISAGSFLAVSPASGAIPGSVSVSVNPAGLEPGTYNGAITITVAGAANTPQTVAVTLTVQSTNPVVNAVLNAGSLVPFTSAGTIVSIFGRRMGPEQGVPLRVENGALTTTLGEARVLVDSVPAPLTFVRQDQINAIMTYSAAGKSSVQVVVEYRGVRSNALTVQILDASPALFTQDASGSGPGAILNQDGSVNSAANPAATNSVVVVFATGGGQTNPPGVDGLIMGSALVRPLLPVTATVGGIDAEVTYAGSAPGLVAGVLQVNVRIPPTARPGNQPVIVRVGRFASQFGVTVAVR